MKKTILTLVAVAMLAGVSVAQDTKKDSVKKDDGIKTIFGNKKISHGGYGAFTISYSPIDGKDAFITGGRGAWVIGHSFAIGLGGYGFSNDLYLDHVSGSREYNLCGGYGGLILEPIVFPKFPVHLSFPVLLGAGGIAYTKSTYMDEFDYDVNIEDSDAFLVAEPCVELEMNLLKFVRIAIGASYRFTTDAHIMNKSSDVLNGFNAGLTLKFGKF
ncbi:MAG: hypothetical protein HGB12_08665 [Bacteroidetes bacterium]|nr:hypothetical protein [Bacteroidota bacterium]